MSGSIQVFKKHIPRSSPEKSMFLAFDYPKLDSISSLSRKYWCGSIAYLIYLTSGTEGTRTAIKEIKSKDPSLLGKKKAILMQHCL